MTPQEAQALQTLLSQLTQVKGIVKDPQAETMIGSAVAQQPDAAYLLVQRSMILEQALDAAKAQISDLEKQLQAPRAQTKNNSFLDANTWGNNTRTAENFGTERSVTGAEIPANMTAKNAAPLPGSTRAAAPGFLGGGAGSMLGTMAATAAGVAGGAFLFQGIGNLLGNQQHKETSEPLAKKEAEPAQPAESGASTTEHDTATDNTALSDAGSPDDAMSDDLFAADSGFDDGAYEG
jgi:hypothetical protein